VGTTDVRYERRHRSSCPTQAAGGAGTETGRGSAGSTCAVSSYDQKVQGRAHPRESAGGPSSPQAIAPRGGCRRYGHRQRRRHRFRRCAKRPSYHTIRSASSVFTKWAQSLKTLVVFAEQAAVLPAPKRPKADDDASGARSTSMEAPSTELHLGEVPNEVGETQVPQDRARSRQLTAVAPGAFSMYRTWPATGGHGAEPRGGTSAGARVHSLRHRLQIAHARGTRYIRTPLTARSKALIRCHPTAGRVCVSVPSCRWGLRSA